MKIRKIYRNKIAQIIPTRCQLCGIGIGVSIYKEAGVDKVFKHDCSDPFVIEFKGIEVYLCEDCYYSYSKAENKEEYIKKKHIYDSPQTLL